MTRIPGTPVELTFSTPSTSDNGPAAGNPAGGFRTSEYLGARWCYGSTEANRPRGSLPARQLAKIAARLAALRRRIAARRQRRGAHGAGGDDEFDDGFNDGLHHEDRRAEAGSGTNGGSGGSGGQSHQDEHGGSWSGDPSPKVDIKPRNIAPVREPGSGALAARITAEGRDTVKHEQLADDWLAGLFSQREKLAADPNYRPDAEYLAALLDLLIAKQHIGPLKPQGVAAWWGKLKALPPVDRLNSSSVEKSAAGTGGSSLPANQRELTGLESFNALLPLKALEFDKKLLPAKADRAINTVKTQHNATLARQISIGLNKR
ncbi:hypothetical protein GWC77_04815 [Paraburkholderia sp. NMBU_R16]|uniref:hypothetical protein n=1 Tax=Paraburkholderia sp. NMBU_R16 TaxID=2698676 RepID=UPI001564A0CE|nr:hypothetical protein [Paraburkholderia sp. NMBU_R16]NRO95259.1 hypothetical protein [Paraburkholderia sp. NMBU_R16]